MNKFERDTRLTFDDIYQRVRDVEKSVREQKNIKEPRMTCVAGGCAMQEDGTAVSVKEAVAAILNHLNIELIKEPERVMAKKKE